jgi:hypothetical protein
MDEHNSLVKPEYKSSFSDISQLLPIIFAATILVGIIKALVFNKEFCLYVKSPRGKIYKFPMWQALRIIRKRNAKNESNFKWTLAEVEPVRKQLSRWQHFKIAIGYLENKQ